jgi:hypothetical protein
MGTLSGAGGAEVEIGEVTTSVRAVDGDALLAGRTLRRIVEAVMQAQDARDRRRAQTRAERRVSSGAVADMDSEWDDRGGEG